MAKITKRQQEINKKLKLADTEKRYLSKNVKAFSFCTGRGYTICPVPQAGGLIFLYEYQGENFRRFGNEGYDPNELQDVKNYIADIDRGYEKKYNDATNKKITKT
jgi:hypothetical protein